MLRRRADPLNLPIAPVSLSLRLVAATEALLEVEPQIDPDCDDVNSACLNISSKSLPLANPDSSLHHFNTLINFSSFTLRPSEAAPNRPSDKAHPILRLRNPELPLRPNVSVRYTSAIHL